MVVSAGPLQPAPAPSSAEQLPVQMAVSSSSEVMSPPKMVPSQAGQSSTSSPGSCAAYTSTSSVAFSGGAAANKSPPAVFSFAGNFASTHSKVGEKSSAKEDLPTSFGSSDMFSFGMGGGGDSAQASHGFSFGGFGGFGATSNGKSDGKGGGGGGILSLFGGDEEEDNSSSSAGNQDGFSFSFGGPSAGSSPDVSKSFNLFG